MTESPKNLIIISIDDLRADAITSNPENVLEGLKTPTLDRLIRMGTFFNNCITSAPYTTNAHASILTGLWPYNHGLIDFFRKKLEAPTIFNILKSQGFKTLWQTDFPFLLGSALGFINGIDKFIVKDEAGSFSWLGKNQDQRLACFFHFANVHEPFGFVGNDQDKNDFKKKVGELLKKYDIESSNKALKGEHFLVDDVDDEILILRQNYKKVLQKLKTEKKYEEIMGSYVEGLNYFDKNRLKPFIQNLEKIGLLEDSVIVIVGDHGEVWDDHNEGHYKGDGKNSLTNEIIKVPLVISSPEIEKNKINKKLIRTIDIVPTCLALLGINAERDFDGVDLFSGFKNLTAFSQHWSSDSAEITILMNKTKKEKQLSESSFSSQLLASAIFKEKGELRISLDGQEKGDVGLKKELEEYNQKTIAKINQSGRGLKKIRREEIAEQLRSIGYNI